tara:strand:+ start:6530 stop:7207 length:678 start_codon:yes stop_codon:yes gene_type:complete
MSNPPVHIVGCGGIGSWTALCLAKMGLDKLRLWDDDVVEEENVGCQLYGPRNIGSYKALTLETMLKDVVGDTDIRSTTEKVNNHTELSGIVVAAVDSMASRQVIFENCRRRNEVSLIIDGRLGGELIKLYTLVPQKPRHQVYWETMWHDDRNSSTLPCTGQQVVYVGFAIGSLIAEAIARFLREGTLCREIIYHTGTRTVLWKENDESTSEVSEPNPPHLEYLGK